MCSDSCVVLLCVGWQCFQDGGGGGGGRFVWREMGALLCHCVCPDDMPYRREDICRSSVVSGLRKFCCSVLQIS